MGSCVSSPPSAAAVAPGRPSENRVTVTQQGPGNPSNRKVRPVAPWELNPQISDTELTLKRQSFWDSQTTGRSIVWQNIKIVAEAMLNNDFDLANTILEAADIRVPYYDLSVCYDSFGQMYQVPKYAYSTPFGVLKDADATRISSMAKKKQHVGEVVFYKVVVRIAAGVKPPTNEQDVELKISSAFTALDIKKSLQEKLLSGEEDGGNSSHSDSSPKGSASVINQWSKIGGIPPLRQRLLYRGRVLADDIIAQELGLDEGFVLQLFIKPVA
jgi:Ubiquitin-binding domain/Ubiquitin family